jgi:hypothetical protein
VFALLIVLVAATFWGEAASTPNRGNFLLPRSWLSGLIFTQYVSWLLWPVLAGMWAGNEYGWGTVRMIWMNRPERVKTTLASLLILVLGAGLALAAALVVGSLAGITIAGLTGQAGFSSGVLSGSFLKTLMACFLSAWLLAAYYLVGTFAAAVMFRSAALAVGVGVGASFAQLILYEALAGLGGVWKVIAQHLPIAYTGDFLIHVAWPQLIPRAGIQLANVHSPSAGESVVALGGCLVVFLTAALLLVRHRDLTV